MSAHTDQEQLAALAETHLRAASVSGTGDATVKRSSNGAGLEGVVSGRLAAALSAGQLHGAAPEPAADAADRAQQDCTVGAGTAISEAALTAAAAAAAPAAATATTNGTHLLQRPPPAPRVTAAIGTAEGRLPAGAGGSDFDPFAMAAQRRTTQECSFYSAHSRMQSTCGDDSNDLCRDMACSAPADASGGGGLQGRQPVAIADNSSACGGCGAAANSGGMLEGSSAATELHLLDIDDAGTAARIAAACAQRLTSSEGGERPLMQLEHAESGRLCTATMYSDCATGLAFLPTAAGGRAGNAVGGNSWKGLRAPMAALQQRHQLQPAESGRLHTATTDSDCATGLAFVPASRAVNGQWVGGSLSNQCPLELQPAESGRLRTATMDSDCVTGLFFAPAAAERISEVGEPQASADIRGAAPPAAADNASNGRVGGSYAAAARKRAERLAAPVAKHQQTGGRLRTAVATTGKRRRTSDTSGPQPAGESSTHQLVEPPSPQPPAPLPAPQAEDQPPATAAASAVRNPVNTAPRPETAMVFGIEGGEATCTTCCNGCSCCWRQHDEPHAATAGDTERLCRHQAGVSTSESGGSTAAFSDAQRLLSSCDGGCDAGFDSGSSVSAGMPPPLPLAAQEGAAIASLQAALADAQAGMQDSCNDADCLREQLAGAEAALIGMHADAVAAEAAAETANALLLVQQETEEAGHVACGSTAAAARRDAAQLLQFAHSEARAQAVSSGVVPIERPRSRQPAQRGAAAAAAATMTAKTAAMSEELKAGRQALAAAKLEIVKVSQVSTQSGLPTAVCRNFD